MLTSSLQHRHSSALKSAYGPCGTGGSPTHQHTSDLLTSRQQQARRCRLVAPNAARKGNVVTLKDWKDCDLKQSAIPTELRDEIIMYGELVQAAYDNLGTDMGKPHYGNAVKAPEELLNYLQGNYRLAVPTVSSPNGNGYGVTPARSTYDRYQLPVAGPEGLSPLFEGLPGKAAGKNTAQRPWSKLTGLNAVLNVNLWQKVCATVTALAIKFIEGTSPLFDKDDLGRGTEPRGTFFGYVALSQPTEAAGAASSTSTGGSNGKPAAQQTTAATEGRDVALVWRGTIFKEEWESNFCEDQLDFWSTDQWDYKIVPRSHEVGVHAGFCDLYTRPVKNPNIRQGKPEGESAPPSREVVQKWLMHLMKNNNIKTITTTGHSLGGGLATICAYDVALWLKEGWSEGFKDPTFSTWETQEEPKVRMVTFAAPRAGNAAFVEDFHNLGIKALRVENIHDHVTDVPGIFVQGITVLVEAWDWITGGPARVDMTSNTVTWWRNTYQAVCSWPVLDNFHRPVPTDPNLKPKPEGSGAQDPKTAKGPGEQPEIKYEGVKFMPASFLHAWGFFHVGQVLKVDAAWAQVGPQGWPPLNNPSRPTPPFLKELGVGQVHNLELYIYLISLLSPAGPPRGRCAGISATRNPLLLNKSDDILGEEKLPATWWGKDDKRGCRQVDGRWVYVPQAGPQPAAAPQPAVATQPAAAPQPTATAAADGTQADSDLQQLPVQPLPTAAYSATGGSA